ncbi:MAG: 30S ribosomal protein S12 methylthiotransferase RimO [Aquificae bacterium]|nr:30S ribosomal protein S12 methylthiotransferase RimO [Aquificota bacterium]
MKVAVISLGCPKNLVDTELVLGKLKACGVQFVNSPEEADTIVINTCGFIDTAKEEAIDTILQATQLKEKGKKVVVMGCLVERYKKELEREIPEVDLYLTIKEELSIDKKLGLKQKDEFKLWADRILATPPHTAYLKISEGCDHTCSFCAIPQIRGKHRSRTIQSIVEEAKILADKGVKELNIVSQDTNFYGIDLYGKPMLWQLIDQLEKIQGVHWIRLYYLYPSSVDEDFCKKMAESEKVVPYIEMPIQHSEDRILKDMKRGYRKSKLLKILEWKEKYLPKGAFRSAVIVGFPTETEEDFKNLEKFIQEARFDWLGVFTYSHEEGTPAYKEFKDTVPEEEKINRKNRLQEIQEGITYQKNASFIGEEMEVLVDGFSEEWETLPVGRTYRSAFEIDGIVYLETTEPIQAGSFVKARIKDVVDTVDTVAEVV